jgi:glycine cleavage system transcriptional repressor
VYGADRPGIVYRITELLARRGINVTDVETHRRAVGGGRRGVLYLLLLEVELSPRASLRALQEQLGRLAKRLGVGVSLRAVETAVL